MQASGPGLCVLMYEGRLAGPRRGEKQQSVDPSIMCRTPCQPDKPHVFFVEESLLAGWLAC